MKYIRTGLLEPGMKLASTLYDNQERVLLKADQKLTATNINRIRLLNYEGVYILEDDEVYENKSVISDETRLAAIRELKKLNIPGCVGVADEIVDEIIRNKSMIVEMINLSSYENYTYIHSLDVSLLSVIIGSALGMKQGELKKLSQAALLHDIGKFRIDRKILDKPGPLTAYEFEVMKRHPQFGYDMLRDQKGIDQNVKMGVFCHHENEDGSGYPRNLLSKQIPKFAKIIHVADVYDALTAKRIFRAAINPADAVEYLMANTGILFDRDIVMAFCQYVAPYPIGTSVYLSNGKIGTIVKNNDQFLSRPLIKLTDGTMLDMMTTLNVTIVKMIRN